MLNHEFGQLLHSFALSDGVLEAKHIQMQCPSPPTLTKAANIFKAPFPLVGEVRD